MYDVEYVYELERYIYVKNGNTLFYPSNKGVTNVSRRRPAREATCHLTPVFHDDDANDCTKYGLPTGKCPYGKITVKQWHYYGLAYIDW